MDTLLKRINELANKKKTIGLNEEELLEQQELRQEYLRIFREGFKQQLKSITVIDPNGDDVTPEKIKAIKNEASN